MKIKPIVKEEIKLSIVICHHIFCLHLARFQPTKNDEIWLNYIGEVDTCTSNTGKV